MTASDGDDRLAGGPIGPAERHLCDLQHGDGRWEGEVVWNTVLLSQYVLTRRMLGLWPLSVADQVATVRQFERTRLGDGSWPFHAEGQGSVYVTCLGYVALRVLGCGPDDVLVSAARTWLRAQPAGVLVMPTWGRIWLAMLDLYDYNGFNPVLPELILLPHWLPPHPNTLYCHTRYMYLCLAYLSAHRYRVAIGTLRDQLRAELYDQGYETIDFPSYRRRLAGPDVVAPPNRLMRLGYDVAVCYDRHRVRPIRKAALGRCVARIREECEASDAHGLSPVNALLGCLVLGDQDPQGGAPPGINGVDAWRWSDSSSGLRIAGARSSAWDTAFAIRALLAAPATPVTGRAIASGYRWLVDSQETSELPKSLAAGRDSIRGGWCFSEGMHRWPVSDCTAEALQTILAVHDRRDLRAMIENPISPQRIFDAVNFVLDRQNRDGGFGTYERTRAPRLLERINSSEMYLNCMSDLSHVECSASCIAALSRFRTHHPDHRPNKIAAAIERGLAFIRARQRRDGGYEGSWGINYTYAAFCVAHALITCGVASTDPALSRLATWLTDHQKEDGGWGEHYSSCAKGHYVEHPQSQAAMTAWAVLALERILGANSPAVRRGRHCLLTLQSGSSGGGWPDQAASGVFFSTAVLDYRLYKDIFPTWALAVTA